MKYYSSRSLYSISILILIILILLPSLFFKSFFGSTALGMYFDFFGACASSFAVIIAIISIERQNEDMKKINTREDFLVRVEARTKSLEIRKALLENNPGLIDDSDWMIETAKLIKELESDVGEMSNFSSSKS
jgi:hypothetical protein